MKKRLELITKNEAMNNASDIEISKEELKAEKKLSQLRNLIIEENPSIVTGSFFDNYK